LSQSEWFDSETGIQSYFADSHNFDRLINQEFDKLNILFSVMALRDYKTDFDQALQQIALQFKSTPPDRIQQTLAFSAAIYPPLNASFTEKVLELPEHLIELGINTTASYQPGGSVRQIRLHEGIQRQQVKSTILEAQEQTLSKILNTQGVMLRDLRFQIEEPLPLGKYAKHGDLKPQAAMV